MFKKGQAVVRVLSGAGYETASIATVARVSKGRVQCEESDMWYDKETGRESDPSVPGFNSRLIPLEQ